MKKLYERPKGNVSEIIVRAAQQVGLLPEHNTDMKEFTALSNSGDSTPVVAGNANNPNSNPDKSIKQLLPMREGITRETVLKTWPDPLIKILKENGFEHKGKEALINDLKRLEYDDVWALRDNIVEGNWDEVLQFFPTSIIKKASQKLAFTTWKDMSMPQPRPGWQAQYSKNSNIVVTVDRSDEKGVYVDPIDEEVQDLIFDLDPREASFSDVIFNREGELYIYAGDGFRNGKWLLFDSKGAPVLPDFKSYAALEPGSEVMVQKGPYKGQLGVTEEMALEKEEGSPMYGVDLEQGGATRIPEKDLWRRPMFYGQKKEAEIDPNSDLATLVDALVEIFIKEEMPPNAVLAVRIIDAASVNPYYLDALRRIITGYTSERENALYSLLNDIEPDFPRKPLEGLAQKKEKEEKPTEYEFPDNEQGGYNYEQEREPGAAEGEGIMKVESLNLRKKALDNRNIVVREEPYAPVTVMVSKELVTEFGEHQISEYLEEYLTDEWTYERLHRMNKEGNE